MEVDGSEAKQRHSKHSLEQAEIKIRKSTPDGESTSTEHNNSQQMPCLKDNKKIAKLLLGFLGDINDRKLISERTSTKNSQEAKNQKSQ